VDRLGVKNSLIFGTLCDATWIFCNLFVSYSSDFPDSKSFIFSTWFIYLVNFLVGILDGIGDSMKWIA
jgi:hypothetical protein